MSPMRMPVSNAERSAGSNTSPGKMEATCVQHSQAMSRPIPKKRSGYMSADRGSPVLAGLICGRQRAHHVA